jgi:hypothetical protein
MHHSADINLAGLSFFSLLILFFPVFGLLSRRADRQEAKRSAEARQRELNELIVWQAEAVIQQQEQPTCEASTKSSI